MMQLNSKPLKVIQNYFIKTLSLLFLGALSGHSIESAESIASIEMLAWDNFQEQVVRYERSLKASKDTSLSDLIREYSKASAFYYQQDYEAAYNAYQSLYPKDSSFRASVLIRMARIRLKQNKIEETRQILSKGDSLLADDHWEKQSWRLRAEIALLDNKLSLSQKADTLEAFLNKYPKSEEAISLRYRYAVFLDNANKKSKAKQAYLRVLGDNSRFSDSAYIAFRNIRESAVPETFNERLSYTKFTCKKDYHQECVRLVDSLFETESPKISKQNRIELWQSKAVALRALGQDEASIEAFQFLLDSIEIRPIWIQSTLRLMRKQRNKYESKIKILDSLLEERNRFSNVNANNLWVRGFEHEQNQRYAEAIQTFETLSNPRFKNSNKREWAKFRIGFIHFKQKNYKKAEEVFLEAKKDPFLWSGSASRMFLGDIYKIQGQDSLAKAAYLDCIQDFPLGYYAHRSRSKLIDYNLMDSSSVPFARGFEANPAETLKWIQKNQNLGKPDTTYSAQRYQKIRNLFLLGFTEEAFDLYNEARHKNARRLDFLYEYGSLFLEMGEVADAYRLARQFQNIIPRQRLLRAPIQVLRFLYPTPYLEVVKHYSGNHIDPFFVYSVMRQESIFNFEITSPAGARGLLQIMPATGNMLAKKERITAFNADMLYNPYLNIRLGIRYLIDLKKEYNDEYMYVLGNYNAGPKPTKRWQTAGEGIDLDIRAEEISYWETRDYIKRVMGNYWIYQEIWGETL